MTFPRLIALTSPAPRCGKSTIAEWLTDEHGYTLRPCADDIRQCLRPLLVAYGYEPEEVERLLHHDKDSPLSALPGNPTIRDLMVSMGTAWGRNMIHEDLWFKPWGRRVMQLLAAGRPVVVDDLRLPNELRGVRAMGGVVVRIERPTITHVASISEGHIRTADADVVLTNDGTKQDLIEAFLDRLTAQPTPA